MYKYIYICVYILIYLHIFIYIYIYIYIYLKAFKGRLEGVLRASWVASWGQGLAKRRPEDPKRPQHTQPFEFRGLEKGSFPGSSGGMREANFHFLEEISKANGAN